MVCLYCGSKTDVTNSRLQRQQNTVWRRRRCMVCGATFTSIEQSAYERALVVRYGKDRVVPFSRDQLFLSIYDACKHRTVAVSDAGALTNTIIAKLWRMATGGSIERDDLVAVAAATLTPFDAAAAVHYQAFHPLHR